MSESDEQTNRDETKRDRTPRSWSRLLGKLARYLLPEILTIPALVLYFAHGSRKREAECCQRSLVIIADSKKHVSEDFKDPADQAKVMEILFRNSTFNTCPATGEKLIVNPIGVDPVCPSGLQGHRLPPEKSEQTGGKP